MTQARAPNWGELRKEFESTEIKLTQLAKKHGVNYDTLKSRKKRENWQKGAPSAKKGAPKNKGGAPFGNENGKGGRGGPGAEKGNKRALGNKGGGAPLLNGNAVTHGLFRKFLPDDKDTIELMEAINERGPLEMLWDSIVIAHTNIIRSQQILFVEDKFDETCVLTKLKPGEFGDEKQWEYQHAWDKQASAMNAYSRAMSELRGLIKDYMALSGEDDHRRLQLAQMEQNMQIQQEKLQVEKERLEVYRQQNAPSKANEATENWVDSLHQIAAHRRKQKEGGGNE
ncbi:phage terminase small subunit [Aneurinibacillus aneurinilyticus]|uniref:phage terminase small subunit n=1 Tax=Aneurinibacillus aneurinilyticus TaxID=1391 RepID=UPI002E1D4500|nr:phage terminase small subunit [Aneurinibacillus aneurinilyticus]